MTGSVYMVKFRDHKNCYKIGNSKDVLARKDCLANQHGNTELIICGNANDPLKTERLIQKKLLKFSNEVILREDPENIKNIDFVGSKKSHEHFILSPMDMFVAMGLFSKYCNNLFLTKPHPEDA